MTETIGALCAINSAYGVAFAIGGSNTETIGAARVELIKGGKAETTGGSKIETVGVYVVNVSKGIAIDAPAIALTIAGSQKQSISGSHGITAKGGVAITASKLKLEASGKITLKSCAGLQWRPAHASSRSLLHPQG